MTAASYVGRFFLFFYGFLNKYLSKTNSLSEKDIEDFFLMDADVMDGDYLLYSQMSSGPEQVHSEKAGVSCFVLSFKNNVT